MGGSEVGGPVTEEGSSVGIGHQQRHAYRLFVSNNREKVSTQLTEGAWVSCRFSPGIRLWKVLEGSTQPASSALDVPDKECLDASGTCQNI